MRAYKYRIYPSRKQIKRLDYQLNLCKLLYNELLQICRETYKNGNKSLCNRMELNKIIKHLKNENPEFKLVYAQVRQDVRDRLLKTYRNFFRRVKKKKQGKKIKVGFPRFKKFYKSVTYPQQGFKFKNKRRLWVSRIGNIPIVKHREIEGKVKTLTIKRNRVNQWFVVFCCEVNYFEKKHKYSDNRIGVDVGLDKFAVLSDGDIIENPRFLMKSERRLRRHQKRLSRKKRGSKNREKHKTKVAKIHLKISNRREDFLHKISNNLIKKYGFIAVEKLRINSMVKNHYLAKSITDASWNKFTRFLTYKVESTGGQIVKVNPKNTTQKCSSCGKIVKKELWNRTHRCDCGLVMDRDLNSAINILKIATVGQTGSNACGDLTSTLSVRDEVSRVEKAGTTRHEIGSGNIPPLEV